jgi:hypothetical protein
VRALVRGDQAWHAGIDPGTVQAQVVVRLVKGAPGAQARSVEDRLREFADLRDRGVITADEYARARVLAG